MSIIVTGGAGFIGSCIIGYLNQNGVDDIIVVDNISDTDKWRNLISKRYKRYIHKNKLKNELSQLSSHVSHIIHMGACSSTTEKNYDYLYKNNVDYSEMLYNFCCENSAAFIYASSAATYGDGASGFDDSLYALYPMNGYGYSKHLFDVWVQSQAKTPSQCVGLKFFNVYGPNEYFKGNMASMVFHGYNQINASGGIRLFKSYKDGIPDGEQLRDFVYVKDVCKVIWHFYNNPSISGIFNVGTGEPRSFNDLAHSLFKAMSIPVNIEYIEMPDYLRDKYQYYTQAKMEKLRHTGKYAASFCTLESGIFDYVSNHLSAKRGYTHY